MKSKNLRKLVASIAMLALSVTVIPGVQANAVTIPAFEQGWAVNTNSNVSTITVTPTQLTSSATKTEETIFTVDKIVGESLVNDVTVNSKTYKANDSEGGVARIGVKLSGKLDTELRSYVDRAVSEYRNNVNTVNGNQHNNGKQIEIKEQKALGEKLYAALWAKDASGKLLNENARFIVTYELSDGRTRTTSVLLNDVTLDMPITNGISSVSDLRSLVDENGLVYLTLRGLPTDVTVTNVELDSRSELFVATSTTAYSAQKSLNYNAGRSQIPSATWVLTDSLYKSVNVTNGVQFQDDNDGRIERDEHVFVDVAGSTVTLIDVLKDTNKVVTGVTFRDSRGNTYNAEVGDFAEGKYREGGKSYNVDYGTRYRDIKIIGLSPRTDYDFEYMDITYKSGDVERTQRVNFNNKIATGDVTGNQYLKITTSDYLTSQIYAYKSLVDGNGSLYQVNVGKDKLTYLVKVDDITNFDRIEVRGLRGNESYKVTNVKSEDEKSDKSNWFAVEITNLDQNRNYDFLSLEVVYNDNGRQRYGTPISLGRRSTNLGDVLFPGNDLGTNNYNEFTTTNNGNISELWVDSTLTSKEIPGGVEFTGRIKDADDILNGVKVYVNEGGSYREVDASNVKFETYYKVVKGVDADSNGSLSGTQTVNYPYINSGTGSSILVSETAVESASEMVKVTVTGIPTGNSRDFRIEFTTSQDGNRVSSIKTGTAGVFGSIPSSNTQTQQAVTRYTSGRAGATKVDVSTSNVKVSNITTTTANVEVSIKNPDKEGIVVEVVGASGVTGKYNVDKNIIELSGLRPGTEYKDLRLTLKYGDKTTTINVPTFKTTTTSETTTGVAGYVSRVYTTFFNREPDQGGLLYWTERLVGGQETLRGFLEQLAYTPELIEKGLTNQQFVERMYAIVDRKGEAEGINFWVGEIEKAIKEGKTQSEARGSVVARMLETPEVQSIATKLGIKY